MIITRTPFRITLGGGGSDIPAYYKKYGGFLLSAAINKYMYITVNKRFEKNIRVSYSQTEIVNSPDEIKHKLVREAFKLLKIDSGIEITSVAELPAQSGLGSSGSFTVGLLNALHAYKKEYLSPRELAEEAFHLEADILNEPVGKQDQYIAAYGGIISLDIDQQGNVKADHQLLDEDALDQLESNLLYFYTGQQRSASEILGQLNNAVNRDENEVINAMHQIKNIGKECLVKLKSGDVDWFGNSLHLHWNIKKQISTKMSDPKIDYWYKTAFENGALGGKIMGAGGGGFFMFYCPQNKRLLREILTASGLREVKFRIEPEGSKVLINIK